MTGTIVVASKDRAALLPETLERLLSIPDRWEVIVVDDASTDDTSDVVRARFPQVRLVRLPVSEGACARNVGVATADTELVAFADDDSWWEPGSLALAAACLGEHPDVALLAACCIVEPEGRVDGVSLAQQRALLGEEPPGPSILGFLACTAVVRRSAFLAVGGFHPVLGFLGEEALLAMDLRAAGWRLVHVPDVVAHHHPGAVATGRNGRRALQLRNAALTSLMRRPLHRAAGTAASLAAAAPRDADSRSALVSLARRLPAALAARRPVPPFVESELRALEAARA